MSTTQKTAEEIQAELEAEKKAAEAAIEEAGSEAGKKELAKGATPEEVQAAIQKARTEEKDKLYPQIEALKDGMKEIQETLREEREEKTKIKAEAEAEKERRRQEKLSDSEKTIEALRRLEEKLEQERTAREVSEKRFEETQKKQEVQRYRENAIASAGDEIIPELVQGDSVEEIDRTLVIAKARYAEFAARFKDEKGDAVRKGMRSTNPNTDALEEHDLSEQLTEFDEKKYAADPAYRDKMKAEIALAYSRQAGRI